MKLQEEKIWEITIETKTQTHIHGGLRSSGMQGLMIRDSRFIIPGSLIKGNGEMLFAAYRVRNV